jgi:hypothetical protein
MPIQCSNCQQWNNDLATLCSQCGASLSAVQPAQPPVPPPELPPSPGYLRSWKILLGGLACVFAVLTGIYIVDNPSGGDQWEPMLLLFLVSFVAFLVLAVRHPRPAGAPNVSQRAPARGPADDAVGGREAGVRRASKGTPGGVYGRVTNLQPQREVVETVGHSLHQDFRLQRTDSEFKEILRDDQGNPLPPLLAEIRARRFDPILNENDMVEVYGKVVNTTLYVKALRDHSTGGTWLLMGGLMPPPRI